MNEQNPLAKSLELMWKGLAEPARGPKPKLTLEQIVEAGIALADTQGLEALSMRTLARELGVGTMSLYRYVPSKTELLNLMLDAVVGPSKTRREALTSDWQTFLRVTAREGRQLHLRHPWTLQVSWTRPVLGPSSVGDMELVLAGLQDLPLSDQEKMNLVTSLDSFVMGSARQEVLWQNAAAESGMTDDEFWGYQLPVLESAMSSGQFPVMAALSEDAFDSGWEDSFNFGLELLLDGLEKQIADRNRRRALDTGKQPLFTPRP